MSTYLDHAATSPMRSEAQEVLLRELGRLGNPSSQHRAGQRARRRLEDAREESSHRVDQRPIRSPFWALWQPGLKDHGV